MAENFERHRQAWTDEEIQKLHMLVAKGMSLKAIAKALDLSPIYSSNHLENSNPEWSELLGAGQSPPLVKSHPR